MFARIGRYREEDNEREIDIVIHNYDTWNVDHTLALIALPMLKQLKDTKHGVPYVDYEDMPEHLQYKPRQYDQRVVADLFNKWDDFDSEFEQQIKCWDWILDEMIYAFDCLVNKDEPYMRFDMKTEMDKITAEDERIANGLRLFGKYYQALWD